MSTATIIPNFHCEKCNITCKKQNDWDRHITTAKHLLQKTPEKYECEKCNYSTHNLREWNRHILTKKHTDENTVKAYECITCKKQFTNYKTHWSHKQRCTNRDEYSNVIETLIRENQDLKTTFINEIRNFVSEQATETNKILLELANKLNVIQTTNNQKK